MTDLVERLRNVRLAVGADMGLITIPSPNTLPVCDEAADEIETLRAVEANLTELHNVALEDNARLRAALTVCAEQFEAYAEHHKAKMDEDIRFHRDPEMFGSKEKYERNLELARNAREALGK